MLNLPLQMPLLHAARLLLLLLLVLLQKVGCAHLTPPCKEGQNKPRCFVVKQYHGRVGYPHGRSE